MHSPALVAVGECSAEPGCSDAQPAHHPRTGPTGTGSSRCLTLWELSGPNQARAWPDPDKSERSSSIPWALLAQTGVSPLWPQAVAVWLLMYQVPLDGRHTARSLRPSPL